MNLTLKIIGNNACQLNIMFPNNIYTLQNIHDYLLTRGVNKDNMIKMNFITQGTRITDINKEYNINVSNTVYIYTQDDLLNKSIKNDIFIQLPDSNEEEPIKENITNFYIKSESYKIVNNSIIEQFKDPDFVNLLQIIITKPQLLGLVNSYLSSGNIVKDIMINEENIPTHDQYEEEYTIINNIDIISKNFQPDNIKFILHHFDGHINLTLRYFLSKIVN